MGRRVGDPGMELQRESPATPVLIGGKGEPGEPGEHGRGDPSQRLDEPFLLFVGEVDPLEHSWTEGDAKDHHHKTSQTVGDKR